MRPGERLLPDRGAAGPMPWVIAVMAFLAALALVAALALDATADGLGTGLARRVTVQVASAAPEPAERETLRRLRASPAVAELRPVPAAEVERLLAPWLGPAAGRVIPLPPMIDIVLADGATATDLPRLPAETRIDRHDAALAPLAGLVATLRLLALALVLLVAGAAAATVTLAARAALDTHRATVDLLHLLGAADAQVARVFARRLGRDALVGAAGGAVAAALVLWGLGRGLARLDTALATLAAPGWAATAALVLLPGAVALLAVAAARTTVLRAMARAT